MNSLSSVSIMLKEANLLPKPMYTLTINSLSILSHVLNAAYDLEIYKHLKDKTLTVQELAIVTDANELFLSKMLRILLSFGFVEQLDDQRYKTNEITEQLNFLDPSFLGNKAEKALCNFLNSLKTGNLAWDITYGKSFYESLNENPELSEAFDKWNHETAKIWLYPLISHYDFSQFETIVDLGGGQGYFLSEVLKNNPNLRGILFDREEVIKNGELFLKETPVLDRCKMVGGSLLEAIPEGGDAYCINRVLLNMGDEQALQILKNCRLAMKLGAKLIIIDVITPSSTDDPRQSLLLLNDLRLHLLMGGCHRNKEEWETLLKKASFNTLKILPLDKITPFSIIEVTN